MSGTLEIDHLLDLVLEHQLAAFEAREFELVADGLGREEPNAFVELPVLGLECLERRRRLIVIHRLRF